MNFSLALIVIVCAQLCSCSFPSAYFRKPVIARSLENISSDPLILTPLIRDGKYQEAQKQSEVHLPGFDQLESYSGYLTVDESFHSNLFFWFFPAEENFDSASVILWLQGGPGASSLNGLFEEHGPLEFKKGSKVPTPRTYSWTKKHSVLYIDNPVGTGFSFTDDGGYCTDQAKVGEHLYEALQQFFQMFPDLQNKDFFIAGESYAGKYVPAIARVIMTKNPDAALKIELKGISIGNGLSDPQNQIRYSAYLYQLGLVDLEGRKTFEDSERLLSGLIENGNWLDAADEFDRLINGDFTPDETTFKSLTGLTNYFNYLDTPRKNHIDPVNPIEDYITSSEVRPALHVGNVEFGRSSSIVEQHLKSDLMKSVADWVCELLSNYRVLIYSGELDLIVPYSLTVNYLRALNFNAKEEYEKAVRSAWWTDDGDLAGYIKKAGKLVEVFVRDAGHMVPKDQPKWASELITKFVNNEL